MPRIDDELHATADTIAADAERLATIEREKATLDADDPRVRDLSAESARLARRIEPLTAMERDLATEARGD
jgi:hypothetical protein